MANELKTLQQAIVYFSDPDRCREYFVARRWPEGVSCPRCGSMNVKFQPKYNRWQCSSHHELRQFTAKTGTIFEDSPLGLDKWLLAMWMVCNCKNGVSSYEVHRAIGVTQKSAWFMLHRIRLAMQNGGILGKLGGHVEVDETFIGGKSRNMHKSKRDRVIHGRGTAGKVVVMGTLKRGNASSASQVRAEVVENRHVETLQAVVKKNVRKGSKLYSDEFSAYAGLEREYDHNVINHAYEYVSGLIHTQGMENFWSLLKRGLHGTYVSVEPFHLFRYIDEQAFRFNNRGHKENPIHDGRRFDMVLSNVIGKRIQYKELTGKVGLVQDGSF